MEACSYTLRTNADGHWSPPRSRLSRRHESAASKRAGHRGTLSRRRVFVCLLFTTILFLWNATAAHAQYVQRQVVTTNGAVTFVGNSLGLNKDGTNDRPGTSGSLGTFITTDTSLQKNPEWPQGTTGDWRLNSSSAVLSLPSGSRIIHAELIWGGSYLFGSEDVSDFLNDPINFTTPAGTTQVTRDPTTAVTRSGPQQNYLRPHRERHGPRQRGGQRHVYGGSRSRDAGHGRSELQLRRLDVGHSLRKRRPAYPQPLAVRRPRTAGRRHRLGLGHLHAGQQRKAAGARGRERERGRHPRSRQHSRLASIRPFQQPQSG